jgi:hypothetical protein
MNSLASASNRQAEQASLPTSGLVDPENRDIKIKFSSKVVPSPSRIVLACLVGTRCG